MKKDFYKDIKVDKIVAEVKKGAGEVISSAKAVAQKVSNRDLKNIINNSKNNNEYKGTINFITVDGATTDFSDKDWEIPSFMNKTTKEAKKVYVKKHEMNKSAVINTLGKAKDKAIEGVNAVSSKLTSDEAKGFYASVRTKAIDLKDKASEKITKEAIPYVKSVAAKVSKEDFQNIVKSVETGANDLRIAIIDKTAEYSDSFKKRFFSKGNDINPDEKEAIVNEKEAIVDEKEAIVNEKEAIVDEKETIADEKEAIVDEKEVIADKKESSKKLDTVKNPADDDFIEIATKHFVNTEAEKFDYSAAKIVSDIEKTISEGKNKDTVLKPVVVEADKEPTLLKPAEDGIDKKEIPNTNLKPEVVVDDAPTENLNLDEIKEKAEPEFVEADKKERILTKIGLAGLVLVLLGGIKKGFNSIVNGFRAGGLKVGNTFSGIKNSFSGLKNKFKTKKTNKTKSTGFKNIFSLRNIKYAALTVGLTLAGLFGLSKVTKHFDEWAANVVKPKTVDVDNDLDVTKAPSLPKTKDLSLDNSLTLTTATKNVSLSNYDGYTFSELLKVTKNETQKDSMKMVYNTIKGFNVDFAKHYIEDGKNVKAALSFDEVATLMSVYNDYTSEELKAIFNGVDNNFNANSMKEYYRYGSHELLAAYVVESPEHPLDMSGIIRTQDGKDFYNKYHNLFLKIKSEKDSSKQDELKKEFVKYVEEDYLSRIVKNSDDPDRGFIKSNYVNLESKMYSALPIIEAFELIYPEYGDDLTLNDQQVSTMNELIMCFRADGIIDNTASTIAGSMDTTNPTYPQYKASVIKELTDLNSYDLTVNRDLYELDEINKYVLTKIDESKYPVGDYGYSASASYVSDVEQWSESTTVVTAVETKVTEIPITDEAKAPEEAEIAAWNKASEEEGYAAAEIERERQQAIEDEHAKEVEEQCREDNERTQDKIDSDNELINDGKVPETNDDVTYDKENYDYDKGAVKDLDTESNGEEKEFPNPNDPEVEKAFEERNPVVEPTPETTPEPTPETTPEPTLEPVVTAEPIVDPIVDDGSIPVDPDPTLKPAGEQDPSNNEELTNPSTDSSDYDYVGYDYGDIWEEPYEDPNAQVIVDEINSELEEEMVAENAPKVYGRK